MKESKLEHNSAQEFVSRGEENDVMSKKQKVDHQQSHSFKYRTRWRQPEQWVSRLIWSRKRRTDDSIDESSKRAHRWHYSKWKYVFAASKKYRQLTKFERIMGALLSGMASGHALVTLKKGYEKLHINWVGNYSSWCRGSENVF